MQKKKILVFDDDAAILEVVKIVLEEEGFFVESRQSASELDTISDNLPDLILLDKLLAGDNGAEIAKQLRMNNKTKHIPIILFSAESQKEIEIKNSGIVAFLPKPFDIDQLVKLVRKHLPQ